MLRSPLVWMQLFCFLAGFLLCATISDFRHHRLDRGLTDLIVFVVCLLTSRLFARKLRTTVSIPQGQH